MEKNQVKIAVVEDDANYSRFFKKYATVRKNKGIMVVDGQEDK